METFVVLLLEIRLFCVCVCVLTHAFKSVAKTNSDEAKKKRKTNVHKSLLTVVKCAYCALLVILFV